MGFLNKIFNKGADSDLLTRHERTFVDCVDAVHAWKTQAAIDPDIVTPNDPNLNAALDSVVCCPYCSNEIVFREAVISSGVTMRIRCPICLTEPTLRHEY